MSPTPRAMPQDFAEWVSPLTVRELRRGLRTRVFTGLRLATHAALAALAAGVAALWNPSDPDANPHLTRTLTIGFWTGASLLLCVGQPLRAFNAIGREAEQHTLELVLLSTLTPRRIAFGNWAAVFVQSLLLGLSLLPYALLRYLLGGVELAVELPAGLSLLCSSATLTAAALHLSTASWTGRILIPLVSSPAYLFCGCTAILPMVGVLSQSGSPPPALLDARWALPLATLHGACLVTLFLICMTGERLCRIWQRPPPERRLPRAFVVSLVAGGAALLVLNPVTFVSTLIVAFSLAFAVVIGTAFTTPVGAPAP